VLISDIDKYDICIIGGGDVIRKESLEIISILNCPKIAVSVTITGQSLSDKIKVLDYIYVRDMNSYNKLIEYGYTKTEYIPDISIILEGNKENGKKIISDLFKKSKSDLYNKVYTIVINAHLIGDSQSRFNYRNMFAKMVDDTVEVIDKTDASFLFIPFSTRFPWDDRVTNGLVNTYTKYYKKNCVIYDNLSTNDLLDIITASDMIITSRFHGIIFGVGNNVPVVTISSHDKLAGFCETIGYDYIDYWGFSAKELRDRINQGGSIKPFDKNKIKSEYREKVHFLRSGQIGKDNINIKI
jgi:polysaccharide pyruvyl transferase WcaK-like protein